MEQETGDKKDSSSDMTPTPQQSRSTPASAGVAPHTPASYQIETAPPAAPPAIVPHQHHHDNDEEAKTSSITSQPDSRNRFRKSSGGHSVCRRASESVQIHPHPSREGSLASSRRSYSRGAFFGDIPEQLGSSYIPVRRLSQGSVDSDEGGGISHDRQGGGGGGDNEDQGLGASSVECESEIEAILGGGSKSYMSRISISMNKSVNPATGQTLFWGFTKQQWFLLFIFSVADLLAGIVYSLQAPFYPVEAEKKGAKPTEYGFVFGVFELVMFLVSPIYGKYMSRLGPRNVFNFGIFITGTCCVLFGLLDRIQDKWTFILTSFAIRTVEAIGNAGFATATFTIIAIEFPDSVATTFASLETFFGIGLIIGPTVGGGLYQLGGYTLPFVVTGAMIFSVALLILIFMPKKVQSSDVENSQTKSSSMAGYGILTILKIPGVFLAAMAIITGAISIGFLSSSLEPHIRQFKLTPLTTGLVFVINGGVYALTAPAWGWLCDRIKQTKYITLIGSICLTVGFMLIGPAPFFPYETILWVTCVGLFIQGLGVGATFVSSFILALRHSVASGLPDNVATYSVVSGLWSSVLALGLFVGPSAAGILYDTVGFRWGSMFVVAESTILIFLILFFVLCNRKGEEEYFRALSTRSSSSSLDSEHDRLLTIKDEEEDDVPDAILSVGVEHSGQRSSYGAITT